MLFLTLIKTGHTANRPTVTETLKTQLHVIVFVLVYNLSMLFCSKRPLWLRFINVVSPARREPMALSGPTYNSGGAGITGRCDRHERCFRDSAIFLGLTHGLGRE